MRGVAFFENLGVQEAKQAAASSAYAKNVRVFAFLENDEFSIVCWRSQKCERVCIFEGF